MRLRRWFGIGLIVVGGIGLAIIMAMAFYLYLPNTETKVAACLAMFGVGVFLVYKSRILINGVLQGILRRGKR